MAKPDIPDRIAIDEGIDEIYEDHLSDVEAELQYRRGYLEDAVADNKRRFEVFQDPHLTDDALRRFDANVHQVRNSVIDGLNKRLNV